MKTNLTIRTLLLLATLAIPLGTLSTTSGATRTVTTLSDTGAGSLRQTITDAVSGDTINFSVTGTISLTSGELELCKGLILAGPGASGLTLSGNNASRVFSICTNTTVTIQGLTIANGYSTNGGGIYNDGGTLNLTNCVLKANKAQGANGYWSGGYPSGTPVGAARPGHGGALYNLGTVSATNCLFWTNTAAGGQFINGPGTGADAGAAAVFNASNAVFEAAQTTFLQNCAWGGTAVSVEYGGSFYTAGDAQGGAILNQGQLRLWNATFETNQAVAGLSFSWNIAGPGGTASGGGIHHQGGTFDLVGCILAGNSANGVEQSDALGGGIYLAAGAGTLSTSVLRDNTAAGGGVASSGMGFYPRSGSGGGVYNQGALVLTNCTFQRNRATGGSSHSDSGGAEGSGGGLCNTAGATLWILQSVFCTNSAAGGNAGWPNFNDPPGYPTGGYGSGGGILNNGSLTLENCSLAGNQATGGIGGGGSMPYYYPYGGNGGGAQGGAVCGVGVLTAMTNCTFSQNTAVGGAGGLGSTTSGAAGSADGGGIASLGTTSLKNTITAYSPSGGNIYGSPTDAGNNLSSDATGGFTVPTSHINTDPLLGPLADNGGPTLTLALLSGSPAINNSDPAASPLMDQRGFRRSIGSGPDIGAFEWDSDGKSFIVEQPAGQVVVVGEPISLTVVAGGVEPFSYQWLRSNTNLPGATAAAYTIGSAQPGHGGSYSVVVSNSLSSVTSSVAVVTVSVVPPGFNSVSRSNNGAVTLSLTGQSGSHYDLYCSSNLTQWSWLATLTNTTGQVGYTDTDATNHPQRFYQAIQLP